MAPTFSWVGADTQHAINRSSEQQVQRRHHGWEVIPEHLCFPTAGTGGTGLAALPIRLDMLRHAGVVALAAAKFHSAAVTVEGKLLTWGWGRGGRLGERHEGLTIGRMHMLAARA